MTAYRTPLLLVAAAFLLGGASYLVTDVGQKGRIDQLRDSRRAAELMTARAEELLAQESVSGDAADAALSRWHSRYKYIPRVMTTADIVEYLEGLTRTGFEAFDLKLAGKTETPDFSAFEFQVQGEGEYTALYHLVWHLENNREFYRISNFQMKHVDGDPATGGQRDLVTFSFGLQSFFGGLEGISAPEANLAPIPVGLLLPHTTSANIFRPMVRVPRGALSTPVSGPEIGAPAAGQGQTPQSPEAQPPQPLQSPQSPQSPQIPAIDRVSLLLIVGGQAVFDDGDGNQVTARRGDEVFGGELLSVDTEGGGVRIKVKQDGRERIVLLRLGGGPARR